MSERYTPRDFSKRTVIIDKSLELARGNTVFNELNKAGKKDLRRARELFGSIGKKLENEIVGLTTSERTAFVTELGDRYRSHIETSRTNNLLLGRLLRRGDIPLSSVRADGSFDVEELRETKYFQENPHMIDVLDLRERRLSEKSKTRQAVIARQADLSPERTSHEEHRHTSSDHGDLHHSGDTATMHDNHDHGQEGHYHDEHEHHEKESPRLIGKGWQTAVVAGNVVIGLAELLSGNHSALSVTADGIHNVGDASTYLSQTQSVLNPHLSEEKKQRRRKISHWIIAGTSAAIAAKAGTELLDADGEATQHAYAIYTAGASLLLNTLLTSRLYQGIRKRKAAGVYDHHDHDVVKHMLHVDVPSAGLAVVGAYAQSKGFPIVESLSAVTSGALGAWHFRPTKANMEGHVCIHEDHDHHDHAEHQHQREQDIFVARPRRRSWMKATALAAGTAVVLSGVSASKGTESMSESSGFTSITAAMQQDKPTITAVQETVQDKSSAIPPSVSGHPRKTVSFTFEKVNSGDSMEGILKHKMKDATIDSTNPVANVMTDVTAYINKDMIKDPDLLQPSDVIKIPDMQMARTIDAVVHDQSSVNLPQRKKARIATLIRQLNTAKKMKKRDKIIKYGSVIHELTDLTRVA